MQRNLRWGLWKTMLVLGPFLLSGAQCVGQAVLNTFPLSSTKSHSPGGQKPPRQSPQGSFAFVPPHPGTPGHMAQACMLLPILDHEVTVGVSPCWNSLCGSAALKRVTRCADLR